MSAARRWQDVKAEAHRRHPELADPERQAKARTELDAYIAGHHLKEVEKEDGHPMRVVHEHSAVTFDRDRTVNTPRAGFCGPVIS